MSDINNFLVLFGKEGYIVVGHDEVDDAVGGWYVGSIIDPVVAMDGVWVGEMDDDIVDDTSVWESNDICFIAVTIFEDNNDW